MAYVRTVGSHRVTGSEVPGLWYVGDGEGIPFDEDESGLYIPDFPVDEEE